MVFFVSIIGLRGKDMTTLIQKIVRDLAVLKSEMPPMIMIGRLKFSCHCNKRALSQEIKWQIKKRYKNDCGYYNVVYQSSNCLQSGLFIDVREEDIAFRLEPSVRGEGISINEIVDFIKAIDDSNEIHQSDNPVVPGLLILEKMLNSLQKRQLEASVLGDVRFLAPLYANTSYNICQSGNVIKMYTSGCAENECDELIAQLILEEK